MNNKLEKALREICSIDELAERDSPVHRLPPLAKLIVTIAYIAVTVSFHKYDIVGIAVMAVYPVIMFAISGISVGSCFYKLRIILPIVALVGVFNPIFDREPFATIGGVTFSCGVISMITLLMKGVLSLMASFILISTTKIDHLCGALRKVGMPGMLATLFLLTYRYITLMMTELSTMTTAYSLRAPGQKGIHISAWGSFIGQLFLRSMDRAEEIYSGMNLRGFDGNFHYADIKIMTVNGAFFSGICVTLFILARNFNIFFLLGNMFT